MHNKIQEFILVDKKIEATDIFSLFFKPTDDSKYKYRPGQYVNIKPLSSNSHSKSYTISSIPSDEFVVLTIKRSGDVSSSILDMQIGDKILFDGPHGNFYPENLTENIVMIAGGIGVTPFYSIIRSLIESKSNSKITLIYSNKTKQNIIFFDDLNKLSNKDPNLKIIYCLTQEKTDNPFISELRRIDQNIINKYAPYTKNTSYYICGSIKFTGDMWQSLKSMNVSEEDIFTEAFF